MSYRIEFLEEAAEDWNRLDPSVKKRLAGAFERLKIGPDRYGKPLSAPLHGLRRVRSGDYRIVYRVEKATEAVVIGVVCHRAEVYSMALKWRLV
mgnify:FL=1